MTGIYRVYKLYMKNKISRAALFNNIHNKHLIIVIFTIFGSLLMMWFTIIKEDQRPDTRIDVINQENTTPPQDLKYILLWTRIDYAPFYYLGRGQQKFIENNCSMTNCYVTDDRNFFGGNLIKFDAVAFNGRNLGKHAKVSDLPHSRSPHQKYIFFISESADNYPVCSSLFDSFFNWTSTYRLDSDIPTPILLIRDTHGDVVGPKLHMKWVEDMYKVDKDLYSKIQNKSKEAAWFVSNCRTRSGREKYVARLQRSLDKYGMKVDVFGHCGTLNCPKERQDECKKLLERDYYFYLAMENTLTKDYVTEKVLTALQNYAVPIVFGGADYSKFLPPGSYVNAAIRSPDDLARMMVFLISNPKRYRQYLRWSRHYTYHKAETVENVCSICASLNNRTMVEKPTFYENFRYWWNSNYRKLCKLQHTRNRH